MGQKGGNSSRGGGDKRAAFFTAVKTEKLATLKWSLQFGGFNPSASEDDEGHTALQIAAAGNKLKSMQCILDYLRRLKEDKAVNIQDDKGRTPLMMAANQGHHGICKQLIDLCNANVSMKDEDGRTARDHAVMRGKHLVVKYLDGDESEEEESDDDGDNEIDEKQHEGPKNGMIGMSARGLKARGLIGTKDDTTATAMATTITSATATATATASELETIPASVWKEVKEALEAEGVDARLGKSACDLTIIRGDDIEMEVNFIDPALWHCKMVNNLIVKLPAGVLTELPVSIGRMIPLITLNLSGNSLASLPEEIGNLSNLKNLDVSYNVLGSLPESMSNLTTLENLDLSHNVLVSVIQLSGCKNLVSLHMDDNKLEKIELEFGELTRLGDLSVTANELNILSDDIGSLKALETLNLMNNKLTDIPYSLGQLNKKLKVLNLNDNPIKDPRVKKQAVKAAAEGARSLKEFLKYLEKNAGGGKGKKGKGKKK